MSYQSVREHLARCKRAAQQGTPDHESLAEAFEHLVTALESDLTQLKVALGHVARLVDKPD